jgi:uncharacterized delta-60 repeat protein
MGANTDDRLLDTRNAGTGKLFYLANNFIIGRLDSTGRQDISFGQHQIFSRYDFLRSFNARIVKYKDVVPNPSDTSVIVVICDSANVVKLRKINDHGGYDPTFGTNGMATFTTSKPIAELGKALFQPDGKILVAMCSLNDPTYNTADIIVARLLPNGSLDNTFGTNGMIMVDQIETFCNPGDVCFPTRDFVPYLDYMSTGKIVVVSSLDGAAAYRFTGVFMLNTNGTIDKTFADNGRFFVFNAGWEILPLAIRAAGDNFYICFNQTNYLDNITRSNVVRFLSNGRLDTTFKSVYMPVLPGFPWVKLLDFQLQKDKKVDVLCTTGWQWGSKPYVVRLKRNGNFDSTFGKNSITIIDTLTLLPATDVEEDPLTSLGQDIHGRLTIGTSVKPPDHYDLLFTRLNIGDMPGLNPPAPNAGPDQTFCEGSTITVGTPGTDDFDYAWNFVGNNSSPLFTVPMPTFIDYSPGDLVLTVTNVLGVSANDTVHLATIAAPPRPVISTTYPYFCIGSSLALTSSSSSNNQWYKDGVAIPGATAQTYNATQSGKYTVQVSNGTCSSTSIPMDVTASPAPVPPTLSANGSTVLCNGATVTLTSSASFGNRWYVDGVVNPSQGRQTYTVSQGGTYTTTAIVNGCESAPSNAIVVVAGTGAAPSITASGPLSFCSGSSVTLTSSVTSSNQWYKDNLAITGAISQSYVANQTGSYKVVVTNGACTFTSAAVAVNSSSQLPTPVITPAGANSICSGANVVLTSSSANNNQWYKDGAPIAGASSQSYTATQAGSYTVVAGSGGCTSNPSSATIITVIPQPPAPIITYSGTASLCIGSSLILSSSTSTGNQWFKDGVSIVGGTGATLTATQSGVYTVKTTAGTCISPASTGVTVTVVTVATPAITASGGTNICEGSTVQLTSSASSGNQWYKDGIAISSATNTTYSATKSGTYTTKVSSGNCTSSASNAITIGVNAIPSKPIITQSGNSLSSSSPFGNQWYRDGVAIQGATAITYTPSQSGQYSVVVTLNGCTSAPSTAISFVVTAINSPTLDGKIQILPNPVHDYLAIKYNGNPAVFKLQLVDLSGSVVTQKTFSNATTINLKNISAGVYIINVVNVRSGEHLQQMIVKL